MLITKPLILLLFCGLFLASLSFGEENEAENNVKTRKELEKIRQDIQKYENQLSQNKAKETSISNLVNDLDREIDLTTNYLHSLRRGIRKSEQQVKNDQKNIAKTSAELEKLKALVKKRLIAFYKHGRLNDIELLLSRKNFSQVKVWLKYEKLVTENDRRTIRSLIEKNNHLARQQDLLKLEISKKAQDLEERKKEEQRLKRSRKRRQQLLVSVRKDKNLLEQRLEEMREAQRQILSFITRNEELRLTKDIRQPEGIKKDSLAEQHRIKFASLKGKLIWPAKGKIVSHFGRHKHPILKTITENLGIEIKAPLGAPVVAVDAGQVATITWQRGQGNIIIISHDDGYYTVYTHLAEIRVSLQEFVDQGQVIGTVGDSGSLSGPVLHFQIWKNTRNLNPEDWLA
ncbi:MAG: peptidoglycan DD-metalloendopeptidase family protein [Actinobacteria bacterium]|nr:peptidoglycan DD-metalloendopeptidase family protein [Actinomycetota bacterium]